MGFLNALIFRVENFFSVTSAEINNMDLAVMLVYALFFALFYYISKWFRAYFLRLLLLLIGTLTTWVTIAQDTILFKPEFYFGLALLSPHIEIVEITYLIIKEKFYRLYYKVVNFIQLILTPFFWSYRKSRQVYSFFKSKSDEKRYKQEQKKYEDKSKQHYEKEQQKRQDEYAYQQQEQQRKYNQQKEQREKQYNQQQKKQEPHKSYSRWDSSSPYEVLGINKTASSSEIKKAYRNLSKVYHPDMTLTKKEEYLIIFQKINSAYEKLKK